MMTLKVQCSDGGVCVNDTSVIFEVNFGFCSCNEGLNDCPSEDSGFVCVGGSSEYSEFVNVNVFGGKGSKFVVFQVENNGTLMSSDVADLTVTVVDDGGTGSGSGGVTFSVYANMIQEIFYYGSDLYSTFFTPEYLSEPWNPIDI